MCMVPVASRGQLSSIHCRLTLPLTLIGGAAGLYNAIQNEWVHLGSHQLLDRGLGLGLGLDMLTIRVTITSKLINKL